MAKDNINDELTNDNTKDYIRQVIAGKNIPDTEIIRLDTKTLSDLILESYNSFRSGTNAISTPAANYLSNNLFLLDIKRDLYDAAQFITNKDALNDPNYSIIPNQYVLFLEDNLFSIRTFSDWKNYSSIFNAKEKIEDIIINTHPENTISMARGVRDVLIQTIYAQASKKDFSAMKSFVDFLNATLSKDLLLVDQKMMNEFAFKADYDCELSDNKKMPPGKAGRFINEFYNKYPDAANYNNN